MTDTLTTLLAAPIVGNYADDAALVHRITTFVGSRAPLADRAAAVRHLATAIYGLDPLVGTDAAVIKSFLEG